MMLYERLKEYAVGDVYPMHMPGHKRNSRLLPPCLPWDIDITEIHGFDDLHDPKGLLLETALLAAKLYGSDSAFPLINGSTVGILASIGAHTNRGDRVLAVSNCHWSTPNAAELFELDMIYVTPEVDEASGISCSITATTVSAALESNPDIKLVIITSPTYEGVISDVAAIAEVVHSKGGILLVDGAHGAHLGFSSDLPKNAVTLGADIVVVSLHKTLPALTQCSLLHVCRERVDDAGIKRMLSILQTSSPSYVLIASIDHCLRLLDSDRDDLFRNYVRNLRNFDSLIKDLEKLSVLCHGIDPLHAGFFDFDPGKLVISTKKTTLSGKILADTLREDFKIEVERVNIDHVIAMTSICDESEGFLRLANALCKIDASIKGSSAQLS